MNAVVSQVLDDGQEDRVQRGPDRGDLMDDLRVAPPFVSHSMDRVEVPFNPREARFDGVSTFRCHIPPGGIGLPPFDKLALGFLDPWDAP